MTGKGHPFYRRMGFALAGLRDAWKHESSLRIEIGLCVLGLGVYAVLQPALVWWALAVGMGSLLTAAELMNSALEHLADHLHPGQHEKIRIVKDVAAAAVFVTGMAALAVFVMGIVATVR